MGAGCRSHAAVFVGAPAEGAKCAGGACAAPAPPPQAPAHKWRVRGPGGVITGTGAENGGGGGGGGADNKLTAAAGGAGGAGGTGPKTKLPSPQVGKEGRETFTPSRFILMKGESLDQSEWKKPSFPVFSTTSYSVVQLIIRIAQSGRERENPSPVIVNRHEQDDFATLLSQTPTGLS